MFVVAKAVLQEPSYRLSGAVLVWLPFVNQCHPDVNFMMQDIHFAWLAGYPLKTVLDAWRAESAAAACEQDVQPLVQLAVLYSDNAVAEVNSLLLKWGYVLDVQIAYARSAP